MQALENFEGSLDLFKVSMFFKISLIIKDLILLETTE